MVLVLQILLMLYVTWVDDVHELYGDIVLSEPTEEEMGQDAGEVHEETADMTDELRWRDGHGHRGRTDAGARGRRVTMLCIHVDLRGQHTMVRDHVRSFNVKEGVFYSNLANWSTPRQPWRPATTTSIAHSKTV